MNLTLRLAWKNLWRNRRRTLINLAAMGSSCIALMVSIGLTQGLLDELQKNVTEVLCGDAQVHAPGYLAERSLGETLDPRQIVAVTRAAADAGISTAARAIGFGLLAHEARSAGVQLFGVDPASEVAFGGLATKVAQGAFLSGKPKQAVLGAKVARALEAGPGDELVVVVQAADGSMGSALFRVAGVLEGVGEGIDRTLVLIDRGEFADLFATAGVHELALTSHQRLDADAVAALARASAGGAEVKTWRELLPQVASLERIWGVATWLIAVIFSLAAGLGVLNAMLMAQYERIPEFGLLKALGTTPARIVGDVFIEALLLALLSVAVGLAVGAVIVWYLHTTGLDIGGADKLSVSGVSFGTVWRARWSLAVFLQPLFVTLLTALAAAVWPAIKAARLDPVEALSHV